MRMPCHRVWPLLSVEQVNWVVIGDRFVPAGVVYLCTALFGDSSDGAPRNRVVENHVLVMTLYLFGLAYLMSFLTYQIASHYFG